MEEEITHYEKGVVRVKTVKPFEIKCPECAYQGETVPQKYNTILGYAFCYSCCFVGCCCGQCCIPLCMDTCKDVSHQCGQCGKEIAYKKAI